MFVYFALYIEYAKVSTLSSSALTLKCPVLTECNRSLWQQPVCFCGLCHCKPYPIYISQVGECKMKLNQF